MSSKFAAIIELLIANFALIDFLISPIDVQIEQTSFLKFRTHGKPHPVFFLYTGSSKLFFKHLDHLLKLVELGKDLFFDSEGIEHDAY